MAVRFNVPSLQPDLILSKRCGFMARALGVRDFVKRVIYTTKLYARNTDKYLELCLKCRRVAERYNLNHIAPL